MKICVGCIYADWKKNRSGALHPSGDGMCAYPLTIPELPIAFYWMGREAPVPYGGYINRRETVRDKDHCAYYKEKILK